MSIPAPFLRTGSPTPKKPRAEGDDNYYDYDDWEEQERQAARRESLDEFMNAVRAKPQWFFKILEQRGLAEKWGGEAQLDDGEDLSERIRELKQEARRICILDHTIRLESAKLPHRDVDFDGIASAVDQATQYLRGSKFGIDTPRMHEDVGAYYADDVVPTSLHSELIRELDALAAMEPKDFHPGTGGKVQDLIHPSLYPYMADITPLPDSVTPPPTIDGEFKTSMYCKHPSLSDDAIFSSAFAWIPTVFNISDDGSRAEMEGYINGLGSREQYPVLFRLIEEAFRVAMPLLEKTVSHDFEIKWENASYHRWESRQSYLDGGDVNQQGYEELVATQRQERRKEDQERMAAEAQRKADQRNERVRFFSDPVTKDASKSVWAGKKVKVVVKAANYILKPGQQYNGTWHLEGMPHERIVASAIYYYERDPIIVDAGLHLRRMRDGEKDFPNEEDHMRHNFSFAFKDESMEDGYRFITNNPSDYGDDANMGDPPAYINVGVVPTTSESKTGTGRIVTFPNWVQHRVFSLRNDPSNSSVATRKILCFFLVNDEDVEENYDEVEYPGFTLSGLDGMHVLSSSDIPYQARGCNTPTSSLLLGAACRQRIHRELPPELNQMIISYMSGSEFGINWEQAEGRRRALMKDRKVQSQDVNKLWEVEYSLCEH